MGTALVAEVTGGLIRGCFSTKGGARFGEEGMRLDGMGGTSLGILSVGLLGDPTVLSELSSLFSLQYTSRSTFGTFSPDKGVVRMVEKSRG